jgi:hypothetical protein
VIRLQKKLLIAFAALLICGFGMFLRSHKPHASIRFSQADLDTNGSLTLAYTCTWPSGTYLRHVEFVDSRQTGNGGMGGGSWFGLRGSGSGTSKVGFSSPTPTLSLLVQTGKTYTVKLNDRLELYNLTNQRGKNYRSEFRLEPLDEK